MSRALTRALVISTISALATAPALALASDTGKNIATTSTMTTLTAPANAVGGQDFLLSAKVSPERKVTPPGQPTGKGKKGGSSDPTAKHGKGKKGKGKTKGTKHHRRHAETGSVTFTVDGKTLPAVQLSHGKAAENIELPTGKHTVEAVYSGDENYRGSVSEPLTFTVK